MKTFLNILGWIFVVIAFVGGFQLMLREGFSGILVSVFFLYLAAAALCFWGSSRIKKKNEGKN